ncbi:hypothetical protein ZWY2020_055941 [Hordeum vulgare]|nr:hypothetical protein ZWY2020_055941 [Hordeum vulgare]
MAGGGDDGLAGSDGEMGGEVSDHTCGDTDPKNVEIIRQFFSQKDIIQWQPSDFKHYDLSILIIEGHPAAPPPSTHCSQPKLQRVPELICPARDAQRRPWPNPERPILLSLFPNTRALPDPVNLAIARSSSLSLCRICRSFSLRSAASDVPRCRSPAGSPSPPCKPPRPVD